MSIDEAEPQTSDLPYDPDQDYQEKRQVRLGYRSLTTKAEEQRHNLNNVKISEIADGLNRSNRLFRKVKDTSEAILDSRYLMMASDMGAAKARAMKNEAGGFDVDDFVSKLITYMGGQRAELGKDQGGRGRFNPDEEEEEEEEEDDHDDGGDSALAWDKVGRLALAKSHRVPAMDVMLGPLSIEQKQRKKAARRGLEKNKEEERRPQEITEDDIQRSENETTKNVNAIRALLDQAGKVNLFKFIVNPTDFGQTVENLFYLSFLIRDGRCALDIEEDTGEPLIYMCEAPNDQDYEQGLRKQQIVMELDMETWQRAIDVFEITEPMVPTRESSKMRIGNKWYG